MWPSGLGPSLWGIPLPPWEKFALFVLVLARISGLVTTAPLFSALYLPVKFRALLAIGLSLVIFPLQWDSALPQTASLVDITALLAGQWLVGVIMGLGFAVVFGSLQLAGELVARTAGLMLADMFDPLTDAEISPLAQLCSWMATAIFFASGSYRYLVEAMLESFVYIPLTVPLSIEHHWAELVRLLAQSFICGLRLAAPVLVMLLACTLILGFVARTFPQLNILAVGLGLNGLLTIIGVGLALGGMIGVFAEELSTWREIVLPELFVSAGP